MKTSRRHIPFSKELYGTKDQIIRQVKRLVKAGNARRLIIQNKQGKILFQIQLTAGLTGSALLALLSPFVSALGTAALVMSDIKVVVEKYPDEQLNENIYEVEGEIIVDIEDEEDGSEEDIEAEKTVGKDEEEE
jgi:hypothetical protein